MSITLGCMVISSVILKKPDIYKQYSLLEPNLLTVTRDVRFCLNAVICNQARQSWSAIVWTGLRGSTSVTHLRAAMWGRIQHLPMVLRVNWSIKIPTALLQLKAALNISGQAVSPSFTSETRRVLVFLNQYPSLSVSAHPMVFLHCTSQWSI